MLAGCVDAARPPDPPAAQPRFDPVAFFDGATEGRGTLAILTRGERSLHVASTGAVSPDGTLRVQQRIMVAGATPTMREWRLRRVGPGRYAGTLTDAVGPVTATVTGARLTIRFTHRDGLAGTQWLDLAPDGQTARNVLIATKFGVPIVRVDEVIRRRYPSRAT